MRRIGRIIIVLTVLLVLPVGLVAQETISASRPGSAEDAGVISSGVFQVEAGYNARRGDALTEHALGELLFRLGIGHGLELRAGLNSFGWESVHGFGDGAWEGASAGAKLSLREAGHGVVPGLAFTGAVTAADAHDGGDYDFTPQLGGHLEWHVGHRWAFLGTGFWYGADGQDEALWVGTVAYHATHTLHLHLEYERHGEAPWGGAGEDEGHGDDHHDAGHARVAGPSAGYGAAVSEDGHAPAVHASELLALGASYVLSSDLVVDVWAGIEDSHGERAARFGVGFAHRWGAAPASHDDHGADEHH